jgi:hypothetical protein
MTKLGHALHLQSVHQPSDKKWYSRNLQRIPAFSRIFSRFWGFNYQFTHYVEWMNPDRKVRVVILSEDYYMPRTSRYSLGLGELVVTVVWMTTAKMYKKQPLFREISGFLGSAGFSLVEHNLYHRTFHGDALFIKTELAVKRNIEILNPPRSGNLYLFFLIFLRRLQFFLRSK